MGQTHSASSVENVLDSRPESIRKQVDESLRNLQTDYIDLYYQHRIDPNVPAEAVAEVMGELIKAGKIHHWGVSNTPIEYMAAAHAVTPITATENQYSMVFRAPEKALFAFCEANHIGFVAYSPLGNGFLSGRFNAQTQYAKGDFRRTMKPFSADVMTKNQSVLDLLHELSPPPNPPPPRTSCWRGNWRKSPLSYRFRAPPKNTAWRKTSAHCESA